MNRSSRIHRVLGALAEAAGRMARVAPGVAGAALVSYGVWTAWAPLGLVCAGGFLLLLDRRIP
ncbi:hypothetical protein ACRAR1_07080 [Streptomyces sanyensis]|uniref:hypothetical protein n=1 Tax=Streptomyces sanyensis TaxID=568869 RepID=UPI003D773410